MDSRWPQFVYAFCTQRSTVYMQVLLHCGNSYVHIYHYTINYISHSLLRDVLAGVPHIGAFSSH